MSEFQMTHVALVGARIKMFQPLGFSSRSELSMRRVFPPADAGNFTSLDPEALTSLLAQQLPLWVHNVIADQDFPGRASLSMTLRRFEGELRDNRDNEVVATVLSAGFRDRQFDPLDLPDTTPMRQRCSVLMQIGPWKQAYRQLEREFTSVLADGADRLEAWLATSGPEIGHDIAL